MRIIELFSEGLYASPNKALEELVANAFDAGATRTHVALSVDLSADDALIVVIDNGVGMDAAGLKKHWIIGESDKRTTADSRKRAPIGKFGIGKLATFVLASRLTHISKAGGKYWSTSMDFSTLPTGKGAETDQVDLDLRELTLTEAKAAVSQILETAGLGMKSVPLFGRGADESWTVAVMSDLKPMATEITIGRLGWVLRTGMPLRDDFVLVLNGTELTPAKGSKHRIARLRLGDDVKSVPKPATDDYEVSVDKKRGADDGRFGLVGAQLGRVTGYLEVYENPIDTGKAWERSNGFFVYVRGRLINGADPGFGLDRNLLRHGTFSRMRAVVHMDRLDDELRSSRESVREGPTLFEARHFLHGLFNLARNTLTGFEEEHDPSRRVGDRFAAGPASLTVAPILRLAAAAIRGDAVPLLLEVALPAGVSADDFITDLNRAAEEAGGILRGTSLTDLGPRSGIARLNLSEGLLQINLAHPFVASFVDDFSDPKRSLPLELLAMAEVVLEAQLFDQGMSTADAREVLRQRDDTLRVLAREHAEPNAITIAQELLDSVSDKAALETAVVACFDSLGFEAVHVGGKEKPDGYADAHLGVESDLSKAAYRVTLEAKSKERPGAKAASKAVGVSAIERHMTDFGAKHCVVVAPDFEKGVLSKEITAVREKTGRSITLVRAIDLARLVRLAPRKGINLSDLEELFECSTSDEVSEFVDSIEKLPDRTNTFRTILEAIWQEQQEQPDAAVHYSALRVALRKSANIKLSDDEVKSACMALSAMAPTHVFARTDRVELSIRPDKVLAAIAAYIAA